TAALIHTPREKADRTREYNAGSVARKEPPARHAKCSVLSIPPKPEATFELSQSRNQLWEASQRRDQSTVGSNIEGRDAGGDGGARCRLVGGARPCPPARPSADREVARSSHLSAELRPGAYVRAAGQPDLRGEQRPFADVAAMADLHQIVDLR